MSRIDDEDLTSLRERLVVRVCRYSFFTALAPSAFVTWEYREARLPIESPLTIAFVVLAFGWAGYGRPPPWLRVALVLSTLVAVTAHTAVYVGFAPGTLGAAAVLCLLAACLIPLRAAEVLCVVCAAALIACGALHAAGVFVAHVGTVDVGASVNWWRTGSTLAALMLVPVLAIVTHLNDLDRAVRRRAELLDGAMREERLRHDSVQAHARAETERRRAVGLAAIGRLGGGFAHEISNRLQAIRGELDLLALRRSTGAAPPAPQPALADMLEAVDAAAAVVRRLLTLSAMETETASNPIDVGAFLVGARRQLAQIEGLSVVAEADGDLVALGDAPSLHGVLLNLALNARHAMGGCGTLRLGARRATEKERTDTECAVAIDVEDSGAGMTPDTIARLFEPLFTTKGTSGTGLGLAGARRVVEAVGGRLRVVSALGQGTTFTILLRPGEPAATTPSREEPPSRPAGKAGARVLVVDDDDAVRRAWRNALDRHGFQVFVARDVDEAIALVREHPIDLAWMDAVMPGRPTRDLVATLREAQPRARLVVCSGHGEEEIVRRNLRVAEVEFVTKPCPLGVFLEHARRAGAG